MSTMSQKGKKNIALGQRAHNAAVMQLKKNHPAEWEELLLHERKIRGLPADSFEAQRRNQIIQLEQQIQKANEKLNVLLKESKNASNLHNYDQGKLEDARN